MTEILEDEFDLVATWTEEVVAELGEEFAIAAACRGSGSPASLAWLAEALEVPLVHRMLDAGAGIGGPAAWLASRFHVTPVCAEPMRGAARASHRLFGLPAVAAGGQALPFPDGTFDAAWALGVLDTAGDKAALLAEVRRVLGPTGRLGLLAFVAAGPLPPPLPEGNEFSTGPELDGLLQAAGFQVLQTVPAPSLRDAPVAWQVRSNRVEELLAERHAGDPRWDAAEEQSARIGTLISGGHLLPTLLHAVAV
ncbi:MAG TPA: methyltransferase domain-containing protein [Mycobacteriales bacterium]